MILLINKVSLFSRLPSLLYSNEKNLPVLVKQVYANELALKGMVLENQKAVLNNIQKSGDTSALRLYEQWSFLKKSLGRQLPQPLAKRVPYFDSLQETATYLEQDFSRRSVAFQIQKQRQTLTTNNTSVVFL